MLDIGWSELLLIGVVALIVVGPKDLPRMFHTLGEVTGKARRMAREFQNAMSDAAKESGVGDIAGDLRKIANPKKFGLDSLRDATDDLKAWKPDGPDGTPRLSAERAAQKAKIEAATAARAEARMASDAAELSGEPDALVPDPAAAAPAPKTAATAPAKAPAKPRAAAKPTAAAKPAAKPVAEPKTAAKPRTPAKRKPAPKATDA